MAQKKSGNNIVRFENRNRMMFLQSGQRFCAVHYQYTSTLLCCSFSHPWCLLTIVWRVHSRTILCPPRLVRACLHYLLATDVGVGRQKLSEIFLRLHVPFRLLYSLSQQPAEKKTKPKGSRRNRMTTAVEAPLRKL